MKSTKIFRLIKTLFLASILIAAANFALANQPKNSESTDAPPAGNYPRYYYGYNYALTSSSLTEISILNNQKMKIVGETVKFDFDGDILTLLEGEFKGATAHYKLSDGKPALVFKRKENEAKGHKIDVSDTWCYLER